MSHETRQHPHGDSTPPCADDTNSTPIPPITLCWSSRHNNQNQNQNKKNNPNSQKPKRLMCARCHRPAPAACICDSLPSIPIRLTRIRILVLQHPHELKRKNRSVPLLQLALDETSFQVAVGRKLGTNIPFYHDIIQDESQPLLLLYPGPNAMSLEEAMEQLHRRMKQEREGEKSRNVDVEIAEATTASNPMPCSNADTNKIINVLVLDGTWKYTKEMDRANTYPDRMLRVQWSPNANDNDNNDNDKNNNSPPAPAHAFASIRTPPSPNHLSTAECIAWLIGCLEHEDHHPPPPSPQQQDDVNDDGDDDDNTTPTTNIASSSACTTSSLFNSVLHQQLMKPLDCMVSKWTSHRDNHHPRRHDNHDTSETTPSTCATLHDKTLQKRVLEVDPTMDCGSSTMPPPKKGANRSTRDDCSVPN